MTGKLQKAIEALLHGGIPGKISIDGTNAEEKKLAESINHLIDFMREIHQFIYPLSKGNLHSNATIQRNNFLASPFKELHSRLLHLTWQAGQVAKGDYGQRVDFMGEFSEAFNSMVDSLKQKELALQQKILDLEAAAAHINKLEGVLPICANCKKIRQEGANPRKKEGWVVLEQYIEDRSDAKFSHSICPECLLKLYPDYAGQLTSEDTEE